MYLSELALIAAAAAALVAHSFRVWRIGLVGAAVADAAFRVIVLSTHLWSLNQTPVVWPSFP